MLRFILDHRLEIQTVFAWLVCLSALRWGGGPERAIALIWIAILEIAHRSYHFLWTPIFRADQFDVFHAGMDFTVAIGFIAVALMANRFYTLWIGAFQVVAFSAHIARLITADISPIAHAMLVIGPSYFQLMLLCGGLYLHVRRRKKHGSYRDWLGRAKAASPVSAGWVKGIGR